METITSKRKSKADKYIIEPMVRFMSNSTTSSIILFASAILAIVISNSPWSEEFAHLWHVKFTVGFEGFSISKDLHHWINDGLMAIFFFVVGLELKREIVAGELQNPKNALLPILAAVGGMLVPALIYLGFNQEGISADGWGIPMATDIAFVLGIVYLLGDRVPTSLKVFLTALAIVDDLGAVLVIAIFYTSNINFISLATGGVFMAVLIAGNLLGVRNRMFYGIIGIGGVWLAFLMSGVHATIAAVLAAMTIPATVKVDEKEYLDGLKFLHNAFEKENPNGKKIVTDNQLHIIENIRSFSKKALTPLQILEHQLHPLVAYIIMPIFAFSNAGFEFSDYLGAQVTSSIFMGSFFGLLIGKVLGVFGLIYILVKLNWLKLPNGVNFVHLLGAGFLAGIGFTMSLFIGELAFTDKEMIQTAKMGAIFSSVIASLIGYLILRFANKLETKRR